MRLDVYLTQNDICKSRAAAQNLIRLGCVCVNGKTALKSSQETGDGDKVEIVEEKKPKYVGLGGLKLEKALSVFEIDLSGKICLDIGASTGGFTDCMLQHGAARVFAVDVGSCQIAEEIKNDSRVVSLEQTDIRDFSFDDFEGTDAADFIGTDVSFISLKLILPHIYRLLKADGIAVTLVKPQFEAGTALCAGKNAIGKNGIVRDEKIRLKIEHEIMDFARQCGFEVFGDTDSPLKGAKRNVEYLLALRKERQ